MPLTHDWLKVHSARSCMGGLRASKDRCHQCNVNDNDNVRDRRLDVLFEARALSQLSSERARRRRRAAGGCAARKYRPVSFPRFRSPAAACYVARLIRAIFPFNFYRFAYVFIFAVKCLSS
ncbi:hypothetical protein EVAR_19068_1 [Eumeta japonica]|uniref:Uncharacterized protein n=1 Tax=Eumeta variegata TaxID=151549 RepID=A0A4C1UPT1_EUMVA|nr:hypothetical protein EVAR_19068_1 [Eumeta japonica]